MWPVLVGLAPVLRLTVDGELVEVRARDRHLEPLVLAKALGDLRPGSLDAEVLYVSTPPQLEPITSFSFASEGTSRCRPAIGLLDQLESWLYILFLSRSFFPITIFWISDVPSPMMSSGASR